VDTADIKIDDSDFQRSLKRFAETSSKSREQVLKEQARLFVRDVIKITPPNKDYRFNQPGGKATVAADIKKIFKGARADAKGAITDPAALHKKYRGRDGRVRRDKAIKFRVANLPAYIKMVQQRVGILASGWYAAAQKLGVSVPGWISRHGGRSGDIKVKVSMTEARITITNQVRFVGGVEGLEKRVEHALNTRAGAMDRQVEHFQERAARGF
jgi:hypothetical protein